VLPRSLLNDVFFKHKFNIADYPKLRTIAKQVELNEQCYRKLAEGGVFSDLPANLRDDVSQVKEDDVLADLEAARHGEGGDDDLDALDDDDEYEDDDDFDAGVRGDNDPLGRVKLGAGPRAPAGGGEDQTHRHDEMYEELQTLVSNSGRADSDKVQHSMKCLADAIDNDDDEQVEKFKQQVIKLCAK
jgi:hypothetical protein